MEQKRKKMSCRAALAVLAVGLSLMLCGFAAVPQAEEEENCLVVEDGAVSLTGGQRASRNYYQKRKTGGELEAYYLQQGPCPDVAEKELTAMQSFKKYWIYYPEELETSGKKYPVVIFSNGTGVPASKYRAVLERLASWGFIVMGTEEESSWNGFSSEMCLRKITQLEAQETVEGWDSNPFYHAVDLENIGVVGHSQGGVGVFNAATENRNGGKIRTIVSESPTNLALADALDWSYSPAQVRVPTLLLAGTGNTDENLVVSGEQLTEIYEALPEDIQKMKLRRTGADHGDMMDAADGYVTAWLCWQLKGDARAARAFTGATAEVRHNPLYQDVQSNF